MSKWLVCGTGPSLEAALPQIKEAIDNPYDSVRAVGVNTIGRWLSPNHLVVLDRYSDVTPEGRKTIIETQADQLWCCRYDEEQTNWDDRLLVSCARQPIRHRVRLNRTQPPPLDTMAPDELAFCYCSPYAAVHVAYKQGARRIGMIGVDLTNHPTLQGHLAEIDAAFEAMHAALWDRGVELVNLSPVSAVVSVPKVELAEWLR